MLDLDATSKIVLCAVFWAVLLLLALSMKGGRGLYGTVGLPLAFILNYTSAHAGALVHLISGYDHTSSPYLQHMGYTRDTVADGLEASTLAMLAATIGFAAVDNIIKAHDRPKGGIPL